MINNQSPTLDPKIQEAISAALANDWPLALELNQSLLKKYPKDIDTMNRLARCFGEIGKVREAKKLYQKVLDLDPYNQIAEKNLKRLSSLKESPKENHKAPTTLKGDIFLEEPGKTTLTHLIDTAMPSILANLQTGDNVSLTPHKGVVTVVSSDGKRIGKLDDSLSEKIIENLRAGSRFDVLIKSVVIKTEPKKEESQVNVFIRETYRSPMVLTAPFTFTRADFTPYVRGDTLQLLADQAPVPTEADDNIEEVEIADLRTSEREESLEELAEKESQEMDKLEEE